MPILQFLATLVMMAVNALAIILPLNHVSTKMLSDMYTTLITPAGFTFSIWSVIYMGLLVVSTGVLIGKIKLPRLTLSRYICSCVCNALWIVARHYGSLHLSMILMLGILISLIMIDRSMRDQLISGYTYIRGVFGLYLGWIMIASLLMTLIYAKYQLGIVSIYEPTIALSALVCIGVINSLTIWKEHLYISSLVAIWALWGIMHNIYTIDTYNTLWMTCVVIGALLAGQIIIHSCLPYIYPHHAR